MQRSEFKIFKDGAISMNPWQGGEERSTVIAHTRDTRSRCMLEAFVSPAEELTRNAVKELHNFDCFAFLCSWGHAQSELEKDREESVVASNKQATLNQKCTPTTTTISPQETSSDHLSMRLVQGQSLPHVVDDLPHISPPDIITPFTRMVVSRMYLRITKTRISASSPLWLNLQWKKFMPMS